MQIHFRLTGVSAEQSLKIVEVDPEQTIAEIKRSVAIAYKLNPILAIQFIYRAKVLPDNLKFSKIGIQPKTDLITVMATQAGGIEENSKNTFLDSLFEEDGSGFSRIQEKILHPNLFLALFEV